MNCVSTAPANAEQSSRALPDASSRAPTRECARGSCLGVTPAAKAVPFFKAGSSTQKRVFLRVNACPLALAANAARRLGLFYH